MPFAETILFLDYFCIGLLLVRSEIQKFLTILLLSIKERVDTYIKFLLLSDPKFSLKLYLCTVREKNRVSTVYLMSKIIIFITTYTNLKTDSKKPSRMWHL